jgi:hypothetical protein
MWYRIDTLCVAHMPFDNSRFVVPIEAARPLPLTPTNFAASFIRDRKGIYDHCDAPHVSRKIGLQSCT